jgi:hypothetical protein
MNSGDGVGSATLLVCWRPCGVPDGRDGVEDCEFREEWLRLRDEAGEDILGHQNPESQSRILA